MKDIKNYCMVVLLTIIIIFTLPIKVEAAEASAHFGSEYYSKVVGEEFNIGLYLTSDDVIGEYALKMTYNPEVIEYVSGANSGGNGEITIGGQSGQNEVKVLVRFKAVSQGTVELNITEASGTDADQQPLTVNYAPPVSLIVEEDKPLYLESITMSGEEIQGFEPDILQYYITVPNDMDKLPLEIVGPSATISDLNLSVGENVITVLLRSQSGMETVYTLYVTREAALEDSGQDDELIDNNDISNEVEETNDEAEHQNVEIVIPTYNYNDNGSVEGFIFGIFTQKTVLLSLLILLVVVVSLSAIITFFEYKREVHRETRKLSSHKSEQENMEPEEYDVEVLDFQFLNEEENSNKIYIGDDYDSEVVEPVIIIDDVCMDFKVATQNVSGIKEWIIEKIKGKMSYRTLHALSHVSFEVYSGEVVGIIGTNGSGKSTLLKIVSGALTPSSGHIQADHKKIQLLTLGTGFDMELTAKENVYLNGAIIGYTRGFIDEHYDEIVAFAELEDFMEEKVKNFSSGMVSRLGFAIATVGQAAEILILDEVLSVGDEFFKKKSLARVKEMIHGGSTVLMVSHSIDTILQNCHTVVWIEKGELKMIGDPEEVCKAYRNMER